MRTHWRHLANMIEFVLRSANPSLQPRAVELGFKNLGFWTTVCKTVRPML